MVDRESRTRNAHMQEQKSIEQNHHISDSDTTSMTTSLRRSAITNAVAGCVSGTLVDIAVYPLNTIKTRRQILASFSERQAWQYALYTRNLYAGISTVFMSAPAFGVYMATYECTKSLMKVRLRANESRLDNEATVTRIDVLGESCSG